MTFKVGTTRDLLTANGEPCFGPRALEILKAEPAITWEWIPEDVDEITPDIAARYDALHVNLPRVTAASVARDDCRVKIVARNGVGYDTVDIPALTAKGIALTNTPLAIRRPVAVAALTMIFAMASRLREKDALVRAGRWNERTEFMGTGLMTRTLGLVGAGGIGQELMRLAKPFFANMVVADPFVDASHIDALGGQRLPLKDVASASDFLVVCCLLSDETRHLIDGDVFAAMKPQAYFFNVGRGPIVDEKALIEALREKRIAGAGLDVTYNEPIEADNPLLSFENVYVTPHALCWTDECFHQIAATALRSIVDVARGERPVHLLNSEVGVGGS
ncbi:MAG: NAD(P)-dependent oxidoreductase [Pseudomonadota bacterium]